MKLKIALLLGLCLSFFFFGCGQKKVVDKETYLKMLRNLSLGLGYLEENELDNAEGVFLEMTELAPHEALGYANLGLTYMRNNKYPEAEEQVLLALEKEPKNPDIRLILANIFQLDDQPEKSVAELEKIIKSTPDHTRALYSLAEGYSKSRDENSLGLREKYLQKIVETIPANIVPRLQLIETLVRGGKSDEALRNMEEIRRQIPELPEDAAEFFDSALSLLQVSDSEKARTPAMVVHNIMKASPLYQAGILELKGPGGPRLGFPLMTFCQTPDQSWAAESILEAIRFTEVNASNIGLSVGEGSPGEENVFSFFSPADFDGDGDEDIYFASHSSETPDSRHFFFQNDGGKYSDITEKAGLGHSGKEISAVFADYDNNGWLDLFIVMEGRVVLYRNTGEGNFTDVTGEAQIGDVGSVSMALPFDLDHEGDIDFFLAKTGQNLLLRNNGDGTFSEQAGKMAISGGNSISRDAVFADFDEDTDIDFFVVNEDGTNVLFSNLRQGKFDDITEKSGLKSDGGFGAVAVGDYNNDGYSDIFLTGLEAGNFQLLKNNGDGTFANDWGFDGTLQTLQNLVGKDVEFFDFDNDGFLDLLIAGESTQPNEKGLFLFHNDGTGQYEDVSRILPNISSGRQIVVSDYNEDGDMDIFIAGMDGMRLIRNDGGNANHYLKVRLVGLKTGSGKNNHFGIGAKLEVRAGELYQMTTVSEAEVHFGLGNRQNADVIRILWSNGVPQNVFSPKSDQTVVEEQILKGSCAFVYTWDGEEYVFVKDMMWRSALGMPMGIMSGETAYAFADPSKEYLKIPGSMLKPKDGKYSLRVTEELWETAYFDKTELVAVDHPDSTDVFVDERFVPPPFPDLKLYSISQKQSPRSAMDGHGKDLLSFIREKDDRYISQFKPAEYQGITEMKDLILDLGREVRTDNLYLFLNGWIFPSDASINVAISQSEETKVQPPVLQVLDKRGEWQTVISDMGFPMGKNKTMVLDLSGKFLSADRRVRIRTNMEIYWDHIFTASVHENPPVRTTVMKPETADLHYRGFSELSRKGGRYGPHWFDYEKVTTGQKWRDLIGDYTRFGDVRPLLESADNQYVIMNSGDEISIEFGTDNLPNLPKGWTRDFLIYSVGWIKDGDLNTAHGKTVEPLPFHGMSRYPYGPEESYPSDADHEHYRKTYNTREVTTEGFRKAILE